jgi:uncharacterized membrane protein
MKICLSSYWYSGIVAQDTQSWKDATIIGWFTTMRMIKYILIMTVVAALVPAVFSSAMKQRRPNRALHDFWSAKMLGR